MLTGVIKTNKQTPKPHTQQQQKKTIKQKNQNTQLRISGSKSLCKSPDFIYLFRESVHACTQALQKILS